MNHDGIFLFFLSAMIRGELFDESWAWPIYGLLIDLTSFLWFIMKLGEIFWEDRGFTEGEIFQICYHTKLFIYMKTLERNGSI